MLIKFVVRRVLSSLLTLLLLSALVFLMVHLMMPGDYAGQFLGMSAAEKAQLREELGLNLPLWQQYLHWLGGLFDGQLGPSFSGVPVLKALQTNLPPTLLVFLTGAGLAFVLGYGLGKTAGWHQPWLVSEGTAVTVISVYAFFPPALAFLLRHFLGERLGWLPATASTFWFYYDHDFPNVDAHRVMGLMVLTLAVAVIAAALVKGLLYRWRRFDLPGPITAALVAAGWIGAWFALGVGRPALSLLWFAALPIAAFTLLTMGEIAIITRTSLAETLHEEYITTARAKGLRDSVVRDRHAARNAILPVLSKAVVSLPYLLAGLAMVEYALGWPGLGTAVFTATLREDVPMLLSILLFIGLLAMGARLLLEILYLYFDPRLRSGLADGRRQ